MIRLTADQRYVRDLASVFTTPIVYHPGGWEDSVPEWLKLRVCAERMAMAGNGGWDKATDAEITCYLYTASLAQPLGSDWTAITLYQATKQIPQLYEALPDAPKELTCDQERELEDLKHKIRNSQLRRQNTSRKEDHMPKRQLVLTEKDGSVMVGVQKDDTDPFIDTVQGDLETAIASIPKLLKDAEAKWTVSPKNPEYKAPAPEKEPVKTTGKKKTATETAPATAQDLPLLAGQKAAEQVRHLPPAPPTLEPAEDTGAKPAEPVAAGSCTEPAQEPEAESDIDKQTEEIMAIEHELGRDVPEDTESGTEPAESGTEPAESGTEPAESGTGAPAIPELTTTPEPGAEAGSVPPTTTPEPAPVPTAPAAAPPVTPKPPTGEVEYWLKDGRGPFATVQEAMDGLGLDKKTRPQHNRWDRLSTALKDSILRKPKAD
jgi:hypothetical protein